MGICWKANRMSIPCPVRPGSGIPQRAEVDGAGFWRRMFEITIPLTMPVIAVAALFGAIFTFTDMTVVYILTRGGPTNSTRVLASWAFFRGIEGGDVAQGAAIALFLFPLFLFPLLLAAAIAILRAVRRMEAVEHHRRQQEGGPRAVSILKCWDGRWAGCRGWGATGRAPGGDAADANEAPDDLSDWQLRQETELAGAVHLVVVDVVPRDQAILDGDDVAVSHPQLLPGQRRRSPGGPPRNLRGSTPAVKLACRALGSRYAYAYVQSLAAFNWPERIGDRGPKGDLSVATVAAPAQRLTLDTLPRHLHRPLSTAEASRN